jgi:5-methylcytosine-specific restriction endonuclease McrA
MLTRADFPANVHKRDGLYSWCNDCVSIRNKERYVNRHIKTGVPPGRPKEQKWSVCERCGKRDGDFSWGKGKRCPSCKGEVSQERRTAARERKNEITRARGRDIKAKLVFKMGGECKACGYSFYTSALEFHHLGDKEANVSTMISDLAHCIDPDLSGLMAEADKCVLLCSNCHQALHAGDFKLEELT